MKIIPLSKHSATLQIFRAIEYTEHLFLLSLFVICIYLQKWFPSGLFCDY